MMGLCDRCTRSLAESVSPIRVGAVKAAALTGATPGMNPTAPAAQPTNQPIKEVIVRMVIDPLSLLKADWSQFQPNDCKEEESAGDGNEKKYPQEKPAGTMAPHCLLTVVANGFNRATLHRLFALRFFLGRRRLLKNVRIAAIIIPSKIVRRSLAAKVAINALVIDVKLAGRVLRISICKVGHKLWIVFLYIGSSPSKIKSHLGKEAQVGA